MGFPSCFNDQSIYAHYTLGSNGTFVRLDSVYYSEVFLFSFFHPYLKAWQFLWYLEAFVQVQLAVEHQPCSCPHSGQHNVYPILEVLSPQIDHKTVVGYFLKCAACCCNVTVLTGSCVTFSMLAMVFFGGLASAVLLTFCNWWIVTCRWKG